ncbi:universal stress protein [Carnobacterium gallinarum]|uniref:universal stress protein n=1 Tax=Carnobacterium gallinarum TaxID=2749 RepID=UPI000558E3C4|nr:universal stress protein [Carnobacterium gallinarum]
MTQEYQRILVAIDGSKEAELAFQKAVQVALRNHSALLLVQVIDPIVFQSYAGSEELMTEQIVQEVSQQVKQTMEEYLKVAKEQGVTDVRYTIEYGSPKHKIAKELTEEQQIDLIMIGATGLNALERFFVGSVSGYVIREASCDVLVVRTNLDNQGYSEEQ